LGLGLRAKGLGLRVRNERFGVKSLGEFRV